VPADGVTLEAIARDVWIADGPPVSFLGIPYPTRMATVRLADGGLWVWSPIALTARLAEEVETLGPVRHLVSPNKLHHLFLGAWKARWPAARLYAPPGLRRRRRDLAFDADLCDVPDPAWASDLDQVVFRGSLAMEEVAFFHRASRTALVGDLVQRFDPATLRGWRALVMRLDGLVGDRGSAPREWRLTFVHRAPARAARDRMLGWRPDRLVVAHGTWVRSDAARVLADAFRWLG
jgi:hypothetical protein